MLSLMASGCGQKGPLFIPEDAKSNQAAKLPLSSRTNNLETLNSQSKTALSELPSNRYPTAQSSSDNER